MQLEFNNERIKANPKLSAKFIKLGRDEYIQRINAKEKLILKNGTELTQFPLQAEEWDLQKKCKFLNKVQLLL